MTTYSALCPAPIGDLLVEVDELGRLRRIDLDPPSGAPAGDDDRCAHVRRQLEEYFAGARTRFELELLPEGTPFQLLAWRALREIPFGGTASYQQQARRIGRPRAVRAIGAANGRNPIPVVVPCHRVIGKDGSLTGFGGGLARKRWLLEHEAAVLATAAGV